MFPGSVTDVLHARFMFGLTEQLIAIILRDLLQAVHYLHSRDMIHRYSMIVCTIPRNYVPPEI